MRFLTLKMTIAVALLVNSSLAMAQWTLLDDFEGSTVGDLSGQGSWTVTNADTYEVAADPLDASNQILFVPTGTGSGGSGAGSNNASIPLGSGIADGATGTAFFRMALGRNSAPIGSGTVGADFVFGSSALATPEGWSAYEGYMVMANGNIRLRDGGNGFVNVATYNADEWYNFWLVLDNAADTMDMYSSQGTDPAVLLGTGGFRNGTSDPLLTLNLRIGELLDETNGRLDSLYYDPNGANLTNPIPEPSGIALAFVACLLAAGSRRRSS